MKIGLTYDLKSDYLKEGFNEFETAEFDRDETITAIENVIQKLGHVPDRIGHSRQLIKRLVQGSRWDLVFNIAEGLYGIGREAQVPAILDIYNIPYTFSDPLVMSLTLHKGMTKRIIRDAGLPTSDFCVFEKAGDETLVSFPAPFFIKPVAEGTGKGITVDSIIYNADELASACIKMQKAHKQPVLIEQFLSGREFTVGIVGTGEHARALGTMEVILLSDAEPGVYSYGNKENSEELVEYHPLLAEEDPLIRRIEDICVRAWQTLGCRDAGRMDIRCDEAGNPFFLEVNPLAGLHPDHSDLPIICKQINFSYESLIGRIIKSAQTRIMDPSLSGNGE